MTISYQLSSQKCLDEGWTVWPKIAATKYNVDLPKENETSRKSPESEVDEDADVVGHQESVGNQVISHFYDNGNVFTIIFREGSGSVFYPSGQLAISIITVGLGLFTYVVQDDSTDGNVMAVFLPSGQGVVYHSNGQPRVCLTSNGGEEFNSSGARQRKWTWHELTRCNSPDDDSTPVDLLTLYPITLGVNYNCSVRIISQHNISLSFSAERRSCRFHVGAQLKSPVNQRKLESLDLAAEDEMYVKELKARFEGLLLKVATALQFPNSPKLEHIPLPPSLQSRQRRFKKAYSEPQNMKSET